MNQGFTGLRKNLLQPRFSLASLQTIHAGRLPLHSLLDTMSKTLQSLLGKSTISEPDLMKNILITADADEATLLLDSLSEAGVQPVHLPLEKYKYSVDREQHEILEERLDSFKFVICGGMRNARHYIKWVEHSGLLGELQQKIHLVMNRSEAKLLEAAGIPAILPREKARPIDIMEFLMRIAVEGAVLYPCAEESAEELPGLLQELEMPFMEFTVCRSVPLGKEIVEKKRELLQKSEPDTILFHSRGSVVRTRAAFPEVDWSSITLVAASPGVANKLKQEGLAPDMTARGTWSSVLDLIASPPGG